MPDPLLASIPGRRIRSAFALLVLALSPLAALGEENGSRTQAAPILARLEQFEQRARAIQAYECLLDNEIHGEKDSKVGTYRIWFRQPELMRIKVVAGDNKGSEIVLTAGGGVRARAGGALRLIPISMTRTDRRLYDPRGHSAWDASFLKLHTRLKECLEKADQVQVTPLEAGNGHRVTLHFRQGVHKFRETWTLRPTGAPVERLEVEVDGRVVERTVFRDFRENPNLSPDFFKF